MENPEETTDNAEVLEVEGDDILGEASGGRSPSWARRTD